MKKKIILSLYASILFSNLCAYAQAKSPSPPYPTFQQSTRGVNGEKSVLDFQVNAPSSGNYHLFFHVLGHSIERGFVNYQVVVNQTESFTLATSQANWHLCELQNAQTVKLKQGTNTISVMGRIPDVPEVNFVSIVGETEYLADYNNISTSLLPNDLTVAETSFDISRRDRDRYNELIYNGDDEIMLDYPRSYFCQLGWPVTYTFRKTLYFTAGQTLSVWKYGSFSSYKMFIFYENEPDSCSWKITEGNYYFSQIIPKSGYYQFLSFSAIQKPIQEIKTSHSFTIDGMPATNHAKGVKVEKGQKTIMEVR